MPNRTAWSKRNRLIHPLLVKIQIVENRALGAFQAFGRAGSFDRHWLIRRHSVQRLLARPTGRKTVSHQIPIKYAPALVFRCLQCLDRVPSRDFSLRHQIPIKYPNAWLSGPWSRAGAHRGLLRQRTTPSKAHNASACWPHPHPRRGFFPHRQLHPAGGTLSPSSSSQS